MIVLTHINISDKNLKKEFDNALWKPHRNKPTKWYI